MEKKALRHFSMRAAMLLLTLIFAFAGAQTAGATETSTITVGSTDYTLFTGFTATDGNGTNYAKLVDGNTSTDWIARKNYDDPNAPANDFAGGTADPAFVEFHADEAFIPKGYVLTCDHVNAGFWKPVEWALKAKLNEGDAWTTIQSSTTTLGAGKTFQIPCTNDGDNEYQYFRFEVYEVGTTMTVDLDELQFYGSLPAYTHLTVKAATCMATGIKVDCYRRNSDGKYFTDNTGETEIPESDVIAPIIPHTGEHHEATDVNIEYWQCSMCSKYFSDSGYTTEITEEQTKIYRTITIDSSISGLVTVAFSKTQALAGETVYLYISDLIDASTLKVNDGAVELTAKTDIQYTFTMPAADVTVTAEVAQSNADGDVLTGSIRHTVTIPEGASITLNNATITGSIVCEGSATITLVGTNSVSGATNKAGIQIGGSGTTLTINGDGSLTANGGDNSAGIGLSRAWNVTEDVVGGNIVINGGNITANGGGGGAGIGAGVTKDPNNSSSRKAIVGTITIAGGSVTAVGGSNADGIGAGENNYNATIQIGTVTIYDAIDKVDASSIKDFASVVYMHGETNVTASKTDYFAIGEDGNRRLIVQKPVIADIPDQSYTGSEITPEPTVTIGSLTLTKGTDYVYSYTNNTNVGTATVTVTFQGDYESLGSVEKEFTIVWSETAADTYTISDAAGWDAFCLALQDNDTYNRFSGKTVQLDADITVTRMAGGEYHDFTGTFDGGGHTLTFSHTATDNYCAPFRYVQGASAETPAVIHNLNVVSTVTAADYRHPAGLIALQSGHVSVTDCNVEAHINCTKGTANPSDLYPAALVSQSNNTGVLTVSGCTTTGQIATDGKFAAGLIGIVQNTATIENCRASVTIQSTTSGDGTHGGLVASQPSNTTITITGCLFDGSLLGSATNKCGGFIGYRKGGAEIYNSLFAPAEVTVQNDGSATFARNKVDTYNCYYTYYLCDGTNYAPYDPADADHPDKYNNGHATRTVSGGENVTIEAVEITSGAVWYNVSGIVAYSSGGLYRDGELYYGSGDQLSLTLSNSATGAPQGYQYGYTASAGTLAADGTLTMPDEDVTISVNTAALRSTGQPVTVAYINADGTAGEASAIALDGSEASLGTNGKEKWYFAGLPEVNFDHTVTLNGNVHIILSDGKTMNVGTSSERIDAYGIIRGTAPTLSIYGQTLGTGALNVYTTGINHYAICSNAITINGGHVTANADGQYASGLWAYLSDVAINGGKVEASGTRYGIVANGTITLGWNKPTDRITASSYSGTVQVADGKMLYNGSEVLSGTVSDLDLVNGKTLAPCLAFADNADNTTLVINYAGKEFAAVQLSGRTLYKDGDWNTLCLPFSLTEEQIAASPLAGATIKTMDNTSSGTRLDNDGTLTLKFNTATSIEAGKPYIIKWTTAGDNIVNPTFSGVTISSTTPTAVESKDRYVTFVGQYSPFSIVESGATGDNQGNKNEILLMTKGNKIGYSKNPRTLNCFRCHFYVPTNGGQQAHSIEVDFGEGETTALTLVNSEKRTVNSDIYDLQGRKLEGKPTAKGMYIVNGRKVIIK